MEKNMNWYVLNVFNTKEKKVKENIEKELRLKQMEKFVKQIVIPMEKIYQVKKGKKVQGEKIYFPGYIMVECDMNGELLRTIKRVNGVIAFLGGDKPTLMKESEIRNILGKIDELSSDEIGYETNLIIGQRVNIVGGPFSSFSGTVTEVLNDKKKILVDVMIFNRRTPIELSFEQVINI